MIVVDTNILAYLVLPYEFSPQAETLFKRDPAWAVPILWRSEFRNLLAGYLRRHTLSLPQALAVQREAEAIVAGCEYEVDSQQVLDLVSRSDCSAYDCEFVALALMLNTKLVTQDNKLLKAFPDTTLSLPMPR